MASTRRNDALVNLAREHDITPYRCPRCRLTEQTGVSWSIGYDDGRDPNYLGYQCRNCGHIVGLSGAHIRRQARSA